MSQMGHCVRVMIVYPLGMPVLMLLHLDDLPARNNFYHFDRDVIRTIGMVHTILRKVYRLVVVLSYRWDT